MKKTALYGALLGDFIGVPYEFDMNRPATKDFPLFRDECGFSDDTVTTIAIAEAVLKSGKVLKTEIANMKYTDGRAFKYAVQNSLLSWCRKYKAGYGTKFRQWIKEKTPEPYNSYGNGAAMRVSAVGWYYNTLYETREAARVTARVTHNHFEGMKGAMSTASAIFLARTGATKEEIKKYIEREFDYDLSRTIEEMRPTYHHVESCQESVPQSIIAFLESDSYESAIRNCIWLGGDVDTLGAICGAIAEAFYGIPENLIAECRKYLPKSMLAIVDDFNKEIFGAKKN